MKVEKGEISNLLKKHIHLSEKKKKKKSVFQPKLRLNFKSSWNKLRTLVPVLVIQPVKMVLS